MRKLLDIIFSNKKLSIIIPICINVIMLLLLILFGNPASKFNTVLAGLLISTVWFFGVYFILMIQVKNSFCPNWFLNLFELLITCITAIYTIIGIANFFITGFEVFNFYICLGLMTYSATAWAHNKR